MAVAHLFKSIDVLALTSVGSELGSTQALKDNIGFLIFLIIAINIGFCPEKPSKDCQILVWCSLARFHGSYLVNMSQVWPTLNSIAVSYKIHQYLSLFVTKKTCRIVTCCSSSQNSSSALFLFYN